MPTWCRKEVLASFREFFPGQVPPRTLLPICLECNHALGERLENRAAPILKPMMTGRPATLKPAEQLILAIWVVKSVLMFGLADSHSVDRRSFYSDGLWSLVRGETLPLGTSVRLAARDLRPRDTSGQLSQLALEDSMIAPPVFIEHGVGTLGHIVYELAIGQQEVLDFCGRTPDEDWFIRIHPASSSVKRWPPPRTMSAYQVEALEAKWRGGQDSTSRTSRFEFEGTIPAAPSIASREPSEEGA